MPCSGGVCSWGGVGLLGGLLLGGVCSQGGLFQGGACSGGSAPGVGGCLIQGGSAWGWRTPREQTATVADGTHPTGMHSCLGRYLRSGQTRQPAGLQHDCRSLPTAGYWWKKV